MKIKIPLLIIFVCLVGLFALIDPDMQPRKETGQATIPISFYQYIENTLLAEEEFTISVLGSSVTKGTGASDYSLTWPGRLNTELHKLDLNTRIINSGYWGYSTSDLVRENKVQDILTASADLVIFETAILNDHTKSVPVSKTLRNIEKIVSKIQRKLPHAKIILTSPNPSLIKPPDERNSLGLSYQNYLNETKKFIEAKGLHYVDIYSGMEQKRIQENLSLSDILEDGLHPNDKGYEIWFEILNEYLAAQQVF